MATDGRVLRQESTYRLSEAIVTNAALAAAFGQDLLKGGSAPEKPSGTSIEAMAVQGDELLIGFRSPVTGEAKALLLVVSIADLFSKDGKFSSDNVRVVSVDLGSHVGFRDIEVLKDQTIVALVGPEGKPDPDGPYGLRLLTADLVLDDKTMVHVPVPPDGSPEAIEVLDDESGWPKRVLVISDGADNGGAQVVDFKPVK